MKLYWSFLSAIVLFLLASCNQTQTQEQEKWDAIMAVHDELMPKMSDINRLNQELTARLGALDSTKAEDRAAVLAQIQGLASAENTMMDWMSNVKSLEQVRQEGDHTKVMEYLEAEQNKVDQMKEEMLKSIENAEIFVKTNLAPTTKTQE